MSLLQYGFERKRVNRDQNEQVSNEDKDNSNENTKKPRTNNIKTFKLQWLTEFSWLRYDENNKGCIVHYV